MPQAAPAVEIPNASPMANPAKVYGFNVIKKSLIDRVETGSAAI